MKRSEEFNEILKAISEVGSLVGKVKKDGNHKTFGKYPTLNSLLDAIDTPMETAKLALVQIPEDGNKLTTLIQHIPSKQWIEFTAEAPLANQNAQGVGSLISYLRRYSIMSLFHLGTEDDDGTAASNEPKPQTQQAQQNYSQKAPPQQYIQTPQQQVQPQQQYSQAYSQKAPPQQQEQQPTKIFSLEWLERPEFTEQIYRERNRCASKNEQFSIGNYLAKRCQITQEQLNAVNDWWHAK